MEIEDYIIADDQRLITLVLGGDDVAFEYLFNRYREPILRLLIQRIGNAHDADDLLQETFIKVYINIHRYSPEYTFGQWVYTIARNTFIDFLRKRQDDLSIDERFSAPAATAPTPEENVINLQQRTKSRTTWTSSTTATAHSSRCVSSTSTPTRRLPTNSRCR